jgi:DNA-directed RNA polymerase subunit RPC12/RpoP
MDVNCANCGTVSVIPDEEIPIGRSYLICPECRVRINLFKGFPVGALITNLVGVRFFADEDDLSDRYCEPGELWHVVDVIQPCPDKGTERACELENRGRCPNQRLLLRMSRDSKVYKTCLYRKGRRIFDKTDRTPVGKQGPTYEPSACADDDRTYRVR